MWPWLSSQGASRDYKGKEGGGGSLDKELASPGSGHNPIMWPSLLASRRGGVGGARGGVVNSVGRAERMSSASPGLKPQLSHSKLSDTGPNPWPLRASTSPLHHEVRYAAHLSHELAVRSLGRESWDLNA